MQSDNLVAKLRMTGANVLYTNDFAIIYENIRGESNVLLFNHKDTRVIDCSPYDIRISKHFVILIKKIDTYIESIYTKGNINGLTLNGYYTGTFLGALYNIRYIPKDKLAINKNKVLILLNYSNIILVNDRGKSANLYNIGGKRYLNSTFKNNRYKVFLHDSISEETVVIELNTDLEVIK